MLELHEYRENWSRLHGVRPQGLVSIWLRQMHRLARPLVRWGATANSVSIGGVVLASLAVAVAASDLPGRLLLAALAVALSGLADGLDGAVAHLTKVSGRSGAVLDATCDRVSDLLYVVVLWLAGAPAAVCCAVAVAFVLHEYIRAAAREVGLRKDTVITVAERPTRVIVVAAFLLAGGTVGGSFGVDAFWPAAGAWCALVLGVIGMVQLFVWLRRVLSQ